MKRAAIACALLAAFIASNSCEYCEPGEKPSRPDSSKKSRGDICSLRFEDFFLKHQSGEMYLIDARHPWFYHEGRIPGAINLPPDENLDATVQSLLPDMRQALNKGKALVVYCDGFGCHDARTVSRAIAKKGLDVQVFSSGWKGWKKTELPTESTSQNGADLRPQPAS